MHVRMNDNGTVEIHNPMFLKEDADEDHHGSEPSLIFDSDKVLLQGTNPVYDVYESMYKGSNGGAKGEASGGKDDEKKGLLQSEDFSTDHPLADPLT